VPAALALTHGGEGPGPPQVATPVARVWYFAGSQFLEAGMTSYPSPRKPVSPHGMAHSRFLMNKFRSQSTIQRHLFPDHVERNPQVVDPCKGDTTVVCLSLGGGRGPQHLRTLLPLLCTKVIMSKTVPCTLREGSHCSVIAVGQ
jgi:hypothetical protein